MKQFPGQSFFRLSQIILTTVLWLGCANTLLAGEAMVAVASNFSETLKVLAKAFAQESGHRVTVIPGSTGKLYAQVNHGAPFDAFFSADVRRAQLLEKHNLALPGSRFTYAIGKIVLWSPDADYIDAHGAALSNQPYKHIAIANPKLAPYGKAAQEVLKAFNLWQSLPGQLVQGENIAQTYQFVKSRNASLGFVALSQLKKPGQAIEGSFWLVPQTMYTPIEQQAVQLKDNPTAQQFITFVQSDAAIEIIKSYGYDVPARVKNAQ